MLPVGGFAAETWAFDGILLATLGLLAIAILPLASLRRYEGRFESAVAGDGLT